MPCSLALMEIISAKLSLFASLIIFLFVLAYLLLPLPSRSVPGSHASVQKLKRLFDSGKDHNLMTMDGIDPNDIATLLKLYLRERKSSFR